MDRYRFYFHDLRKEEKYLYRRPSALGAVMVWGAISYRRVIDLVFVDGWEDLRKYIELLREEKIKIDEIFDGENWIFQQDNAGFHTARLVKTLFQDNDIQILEWPALSPDLNIIENLWG